MTRGYETSMDSASTSIDIASIKARALAPLEEPGSVPDSHQINFAHQALQHPLLQPGQKGAEHILGNDHESTGLPSTVPESHPVFDADILESLPPEASTTIPSRKMNSQGGLEATQELSPSYWEQHISRSALHAADDETQHTLNEGDEGHVDILSSFRQDEEEDEEPRGFSPTQSPCRLSQFPESQRFKTPATAGRKRDYNGNTRESPELPRAPVLRSGLPTPAHAIGLTQAFDATQAATSPFISGAINPLSDRPSPNLVVENRPATANVSSPLRPMSEFKRATTEPASRYRSVAESQAERDRRVQEKLLDDQDEISDDEFSEEPSMIKKQRWRRERERRTREQLQLLSSPARARPLGDSAIKSSPVIAAQRSSPSPPPGLRLSVSRRIFDQDLVPDEEEEDVQSSEAETEQEEEEEIDVNVRRSSQSSPPDEEDKENYDRIPETAARLHRITSRPPIDIEASPSFRHDQSAAPVPPQPLPSSGVAVANSQPSQPARRSQILRQNPKSSSTSGVDFVPQSQGNSGQKAASAAATQTPPASPKPHLEQIPVEQTLRETGGSDIALEQGLPTEQASAPTTLQNTVLETDSVKLLHTEHIPRSTNSAPGANTLSTGLFETALTRLPPGSDPQSKLSELSSQPIAVTPPGRKRKRMADISAEPSPRQQSTQGFDPTEALHIDSQVQPYLDESPIRPTARQTKRRRLREPSPEVNETIQSIARHSTRQTQHERNVPEHQDLGLPENADTAASVQPSQSLEPPSLRPSTRLRPSVWEMDASPPQKRVPARMNPKQPPTTTAQVLPQKKQPPASTAPVKQQTRKAPINPLQAQTQADVSLGKRSESPALASKPPPGETIAPNNVFACFNGKTRAYYPARCLGISGGESLRYRVQWEGYDPDEVDVVGVKSLDLRVGDQVKIDQEGFPKVSYVIRGFIDKLEIADLGNSLTDVRGHKTLLVAPKQRKSLPAEMSTESVNEVPISVIYLDSNMWNQMKDRNYEFKQAEEAAISLSGYATPAERPSTPSTPSSRSRRKMEAQVIVELPKSTGIFANMAFAMSYEDASRKNALLDLIQDNGGRLLRENFVQLLEADSVDLNAQYANGGFTALIADKHSRKEKYMQALALGLPCLSGKWIEACILAKAVVEWQPYLLAAGESEELEGATKSRIMANADLAEVRLVDLLDSRSVLLKGAKVIVVMGRGKSEAKRKPYLFLIQALGAERIEKVQDLKAAKEFITDAETFDWVFVEDNVVEVAKAELMGKSSKKKGAGGSCKVAGNELIVQSLIMGKLVDI